MRSIEDEARAQTAEYVANAMIRAVMLLEGAAKQHPDPGYHNYWLRVDAECLRIVAKELRIYHAKQIAFG